MSAYANRSRLHELLNYDPQTGVFTWKPRRGCRVGVPLGCSNGNGYLRITVDGKSCYAHRLAWVYVNGETHAPHIDHINGVRSDNRISNLRPATACENNMNRHGAQKNSRSGVRGVSWHKRAGKWQVHKGHRYLGLFQSICEAVSAWEKA